MTTESTTSPPASATASTSTSKPADPSTPNDATGLKTDLRLFGSGVMMGACDVVPGVSGGTMALVLGVYERLLHAITQVNRTLLSHVIKRDFRAAAEHLDFRFLAALGAGIAGGIISLASLMHFLLDTYETRTHAVFCGLILASTLIVARKISSWTGPVALAFFLGTAGAAFLVGLPILQNTPSARWYVFVSGAIGICAMILPGISGAFILLILGKYKYITGLLKAFLHGEASVADILTIAVFCLGCLTGLLVFSRILKALLARHHDVMIAVLAGFMLGSLRKLWPIQQWPPQDGSETVLVGTLLVLATGAVLLVDLAARIRQRT